MQSKFSRLISKSKNKSTFNIRKYGNSNNKNGKVLTHFIEVCLMEANNPSKVGKKFSNVTYLIIIDIYLKQ